MEKTRNLRNTNPNLPQKSFDEFLGELKKITDTGVKVVDVINDFVNIKDTLEALDTLDNLEIKPFGNYGAHIIIPSKYLGKKVKIIIKK